MQNQLLFFPEEIEDETEKRFSLLDEKYHNLRKSQHARISGLQKEVKELKEELNFLKSKICKDQLFV